MVKLALAAIAALFTVAGGFAWGLHAAPAPPPATRSDRVASDVAALEAAVDELEERLLASQARLGLWDELRTRHEEVSAVACANLTEHALAIEKRESRLQAQASEAKRGRGAGAARPVIAASAAPAEE